MNRNFTVRWADLQPKEPGVNWYEVADSVISLGVLAFACWMILNALFPHP